MPLVRLELRNEFGLGNPDLFQNASRIVDPNEVLDGVAISGLVGILRQLGDLAVFASEIFSNLHEQVVATSALGHKLVARLKRIETVLPKIENAVQNQKSHIYFARIPGHVWHCNIEIEHYHFLGNNLPQFIMDYYEECHNPPRLFMLDKFDRAGSGSCLKRYSDPTYFRRTMTGLEMIKEEKIKNENKTDIYKWKETRMLSKKIRHAISLSHYNSSVQSNSMGTNEQRTTEGTIPACDIRSKSDIGSRTMPSNLTTNFSCKKTFLDTSSSVEPEKSTLIEPKSKSKTNNDEDWVSEEIASTSDIKQTSNLENRSRSFNTWKTTNFIYEKQLANANSSADTNSLSEPGEASFNKPLESSTKIDDDEEYDSAGNNSLSDTITENGQSERTQFYGYKSFHVSESPMYLSSQLKQKNGNDKNGQSDQEEIQVHIGSISLPDDQSASLAKTIHHDEVTNEVENYLDTRYAFESEMETDTDSEFQTTREAKSSSIKTNQAGSMADNMQKMDISESDSIEDSYSSMSENFHEESSPKHSNSISFEIVNNFNAASLGRDENISVGIDFNGSKEIYLSKSSGKNEFSDEQYSQFSTIDVQSQSSLSNINNLLFEDEQIVDSDNAREICEFSEEPSIKISTNGGILGLKSPKPINEVASTYGVSTDGCKCSRIVISNELDNNRSLEKDEIVVLDCSKTGHDNFQKLKCTTVCRKEPNLFRSELAHCENEFPAALVKVSSDELCPKNTRISSSPPALATGFLEKNIMHNSAITKHDQSQPFSITPTSNALVLREKSYGNVPSQQCQYGMKQIEETISSRSQYHGSSSSASPPLEDMKISFHPINSMVASTLKMEFPDSHLRKNIEEIMFPSFQILQVSSVSTDHLVFDSDDETFYKSSPSCSENFIDHHSDSDFEVWELEDCSVIRNHDVLNALHPVLSSNASISNSSDLSKMNHCLLQNESDHENLTIDENDTTTFQSGYSTDLPCLDFWKTLDTKQEGKYDPGIPGNSESEDCPSSCTNEKAVSSPVPPCSHLENKQHCLSENTNSSVDPDLDPKRSIKQTEQVVCMRPELLEPIQVEKRKLHCSMSMIDCNEMNGNHEEVAKTEVDKEMGEFLHELRSKSFNLRRTVIAKSDFAPRPTTNSKIAAILEKAEAIRRVEVGDDDDEGCGSWSDY